MCTLTWTIWGTIVSTIVLFIVIDQSILGGKFTKCFYHKMMLRDIFEVYYEPELEQQETQHTAQASSDLQDVYVTLRMKKDVYIEFINFKFNGEGSPPIIPNVDKEDEGLYEWNWVNKKRPPNVYTNETRDGRYFWQYHQNHHRGKKDRIRIGIKYKAPSKFDGNLEVELKTVDKRQKLTLGFHVKE